MPALPPDRPGCPKAPGGRRPLPDLAAVRLYLVPDPAPPYDEEVPAGDQGCGGLPGWAPRAASPGAEAPRAGVPRAGEPGQAEPGRSEPGRSEPGRSEPGRSERGRMEPAHGMGRGEPADTEGRDGRPAQGGSQGIPRPPAAATGTPPGWPGRFAQVLAEALAGSRPPRQLVPWTTQETLDRIQRLGPRLASAQRPLVRRVVTSRPAEDVLEMTVVVGFGPKVKAMAVRLERTGTRLPARRGEPLTGRWVCTAVEAA